MARLSSTGFNCRLFWVGSWAAVPFSVLKGIGVLGWWVMDTFLLTESCILRGSQVCLQSQVFGVKIISKFAAMAALTSFRWFLRSSICFLLYSYHLIFLCLIIAWAAFMMIRCDDLIVTVYVPVSGELEFLNDSKIRFEV